MQERLSMKEKVSYGLGDLGSCLVYSTQSYYLMYYYTNVVGISLVAAGNIMLLVRAFSFVDPIVGVLVDRTNTKAGKARPYLLWFALPLMVMMTLTFSVPALSPGGKSAFAAVTYLLTTVMYAAHNLPYGILLQLMTKNQADRSSLSMFRMLGANAGMLLVSALTLPLVSLLGRGNDHLGFTLTAGGFACVAAVISFVTYTQCRERVLPRPGPGGSPPLGKSLKALVQNPPWVILSVNSVFGYIRTVFPTTMLIYYVMYSLGEGEVMTSLFLTLGSLGKIATTVLTPRLVGRIGKKRTMLLGIALPMAGYLAGMAVGERLLPAVLCYTLATTPVGFTMTLDYSMLPDTVEYGEWRTGVRTDGLTYSAFSFVTKVAMGIGGALVGYSLTLIGLDTGAQAQSPATLQGLRVLMYGVPAVLSLLQLVVMSFYRLDESTCEKVMEELEMRSAATKS